MKMTQVGLLGLVTGISVGLWLVLAEPTVRPKPNTDSMADGETEQPVMHKQTQDWPLYRGSQGLSGQADVMLNKTLDLLWSFKTGRAVRSSAVIQDGCVYIGSADKHLYALDFETGHKIWAYQTEFPIEASPTVIQETVYIGDLGGQVYAVDRVSGELRWTYQTDGEVTGAVNWATFSGRLCILVTSHDKHLHCVEAGTGEVVWQFEAESMINGTPSVSDGLCAFGACDSFIYVVRVSDGKEVVRIKTSTYVASSVVLDQGRVFAGNYNGELVSAAVSDPNQKWEYIIDRGEIYSSAAVTEDRVVWGDRSDQVLCVDRNSGEKIWHFQTLGDVDSSPVISQDKVVVGANDGRVYLLSLDTGDKLWSYELGKPVMSSPAVSDGCVIIGCDDGRVYAFGKKSVTR